MYTLKKDKTLYLCTLSIHTLIPDFRKLCILDYRQLGAVDRTVGRFVTEYSGVARARFARPSANPLYSVSILATVLYSVTQLSILVSIDFPKVWNHSKFSDRSACVVTTVVSLVTDLPVLSLP